MKSGCPNYLKRGFYNILQLLSDVVIIVQFIYELYIFVIYGNDTAFTWDYMYAFIHLRFYHSILFQNSFFWLISILPSSISS